VNEKGENEFLVNTPRPPKGGEIIWKNSNKIPSREGWGWVYDSSNFSNGYHSPKRTQSDQKGLYPIYSGLFSFQSLKSSQ